MTHPSPRTLLARYDLDAKKTWGQNFLGDRHVPERIARATGAQAGDTIVEIGPGLGHLTAALLETGAHVVAIERDRDMARVLRGELGASPRFELFEDNALTMSLAVLAERAGGRLLVAGNLPYHIASQLIVRLLDERAHVRRFVVMVQKEMGDRLAAAPGSRTYGTLSALARAFTDVTRLFDVSRGAFVPPPRVTSSVLRFEVRPEPRAPIADEAWFRWTVHAAFSSRRKTLRNALLHAFEVGARGEGPPHGRLLDGPREAAGPVDAALSNAAIEPTARAETLDVAPLARLACALAEALKTA